MSEGKKFDALKAPIALVPPEAIVEEAYVWGFGAEKYGLYNFRKGISYVRILSAMLRHTFAIVRGEDRDPETGLLHAAHVRCCAGMLIVLHGRKDLDDRFSNAE